MRILIDYRPALRERTGVGEHVHRLAQALGAEVARRPDASMTLFSSSWRHRLAPNGVAGAHLVDRRIPVRLLNWLWHRLGWPPVEQLAGPCDVAHSPHPLAIPTRHAARFITIHDLDFLEHPERTSAEIRRDYPTLVRRHAAQADRVVVPSRHTGALVQTRLEVPATRIVLCHNGAPNWPVRVTPSPGGPILFVGTIEPRKNVPGLLRAYTSLLAHRANLPDLVLAGRVATPSLTELDARGPAQLTGRVRFLGYVDPTALHDLYARASVLVLPSFDEGFGLPVLEAMTVGVPVVASTRGALPELVGDAGALVDPDDVDGLARAIAQVLDDPDHNARTVARGFIRARSYDWGASARTLLAAYDAVLRERG